MRISQEDFTKREPALDEATEWNNTWELTTGKAKTNKKNKLNTWSKEIQTLRCFQPSKNKTQQWRKRSDKPENGKQKITE